MILPGAVVRIPERKLLSVIDAIYRAAMDSDAWQEVVDGLHELLPQTCINLQGYQAGEKPAVVTVNAGWDPSLIQYYEKNLVALNPYPALVPQMEVGVPVIADESRFIELVRKTDFYNDWLVKYDVASAVGVPLWNAPERVCFVAFEYSHRRSTKLNKPVAELASIIAPHLARAFEVSHRLASVHHGPAQFAPLLRRIRGPAVVVDHRRRLRLANGPCEALLRSGRDLKLDRDGSVALADAAANASLADAVQACFAPALAAPPYAVSFRTAEGRRPSWLNVVPLVADDMAGKGPLARFLAERERLALLIVSTPWEPALDTASRLRTAFLLTPAEVKLAVALMEGSSLDAYARDRGIAVTTARNQLQSLFEKTGAHRQGELVATLFAELGHPARQP